MKHNGFTSKFTCTSGSPNYRIWNLTLTILALVFVSIMISQDSSAEINATITSSSDSVDRTDTISLYGNATGSGVDEENLTTAFEYLVYR